MGDIFCSPRQKSVARCERTGVHGLGFSLIEVVLALGVTSFALVAIISLVSVVMKTGQDGRHSTEGAMLFKKVVAQLRVKPFAEAQEGTNMSYPLPALNNASNKTEFFVNSLGEFGGTNNGTLPTDAQSVVAVVVLDAQDLSMAGMTAPPQASNGRLAFVRVEIAPAPLFKSTNTNSRDIYVTEIVSLEQ